jgi:hypothetical protein
MLTCTDALNPSNYQAPQSPEFSKLARAFFGGLPVPEDINEDTREEDQTLAIRELKDDIANDCGDSVHEESSANPQKQQNMPHVSIRFSTGAFSEVLRERPIEDKVLICFLQDCAIANRFEEACAARKPLPFGVKVYRTDRHSWVRDATLGDIVSSRSEKQYTEVSARTISGLGIPTIQLLMTKEVADHDTVLETNNPTDTQESSTKAKAKRNHPKSKDAKKKTPRARVTSKQKNDTMDDYNEGGSDTDHSIKVTDHETLKLRSPSAFSGY